MNLVGEMPNSIPNSEDMQSGKPMDEDRKETE